MKTRQQFNDAVLQIVCAKEAHGIPMKDQFLVDRSIQLAKELFKQLNLPVYETED